MDAQRKFLDICAQCKKRQITLPKNADVGLMQIKREFTEIQTALKYVNGVIESGASIE